MSDFSLTVLNPQGNDPEQYFPDFAGTVSATVPAPVNYHAYAACVAGCYQRETRKAIDLRKPVLMLIRHDLKASHKALLQLKKAGLTTAVTLKETGYHQLHKLLGSERKIRLFREIVNLADGVVSSTLALLPVYRALCETLPPEHCQFIATPYPVNDPRWDFAVPISERAGIYVGTREFKAASRNHLQCLILVRALATEFDCPVGIVNSEGRQLERVLQSLDFPMRKTEIRTRMAYAEYLRFTAKYRVVFQLDQSMVPGQVAGDCCLTRQIAVGGNGSLDQIVFSPFCGNGQDRDGLLRATRRLLTDDDYYRAAIGEASEAAALVSFERVAQELRTFYAMIHP